MNTLPIARRRRGFSPHPIAAACATLLFAFGAHAQQAGPTQAEADARAKAKADAAAKAESERKAADLGNVTVTGIRRGIEAAISVKKNSDSIVEAVSAEDIGKLPDNSIAESIARLPGLAAQRVAGKAQVISVRGLSPDFATSLLNGRELVSTGDNRSVEFDQYPSELMSSVLVYKTPDAGLIGQGLSGTIDLQTVRPLSFSSRAISLTGRYTRNSLGSAADSSANGNRFSASYIDQFANRTFGVALGYAHSETPVQENQVGMYEPWEVQPRVGVPAGTFISDGIKALRRTGKLTRDGLLATLQWRPSDKWESTFDVFHSQDKQTDTANQFESHLYFNGDYPCKPDCAWTPTVNSNQTLTGGTVTNVYPLIRGMYNKRDDKINALGLNNKFSLGDVAFVADIGYSKATRDETNLETSTQLLPSKQLDTLNLTFRGDGFSSIVPGRSYADPTKLYLTNTIYGSGYGKVPHVDDELKSFKLSASVPSPAMLATVLADFDIGVNYADRQKSKRQPEGNINLGKQGDTTIGSDLQYAPVDLGFAGLGSIPAWDVPGAVGRYMSFTPVDNLSYLIPKAWTVTEKITTGYVKANIDSQWGSIGVRGNIGVQIQRVDQGSSSNYFDSSAPAGSEVKPFHDGKTYTDILPSMNLAFLLGNDQTLRFALAKQVARPKVDQLRSSLEFGVSDAGIPGASGGNPQLDPWRANALDISYEKYFDTKAYFAAAFYYKDLKSYIYTQSQTYDFSQFTNGVTKPPLPVTNVGQFTAPYNGQGGSLKGLELSGSVPLSMLTPALNGFGIIASASYNQSSVKVRDPESASSVGGGDIALPGLSKNVYSLTAYYERAGFEARISERRRSDFIGEVGNFSGTRILRYVVGEDIVDAQLGYKFGDGPLKGLSLTFQVNNLTDAAYRTYSGSKDRPLEYIKWGRTYALGAAYKF